MLFFVDRNVVMRRIPVLTLFLPQCLRPTLGNSSVLGDEFVKKYSRHSVTLLTARSLHSTPSRYIISISLYVMAFGTFVCIQRTATYDVPTQFCVRSGSCRRHHSLLASRHTNFSVCIYPGGYSLLFGGRKAIHRLTCILYKRRLPRRLYFHIL